MRAGLLRLLNPAKGKPAPPLAVQDNAALLEALGICREALRGHAVLSDDALDALDELLAMPHPGYSVLREHAEEVAELREQLEAIRPRPVLAGKETRT